MRVTIDRVFVGGSSRVFGSQMLGGSTVRSSRYSSMPSMISCLDSALYDIAQNTFDVNN